MHPNTRFRDSNVPDFDEVCDICLMGNSDEGNLIVFCDKCGVGVHQKCYVTTIPEDESEDWLCKPCDHGMNTKLLECQLCPAKGGAYSKMDGRWAHDYCGLWIPELWWNKQGEIESDNPNLTQERKSLKCMHCKTKEGACIQCNHGKCAVPYHPTCAHRDNDVEVIWDGERFNLICPKHTRKSKNGGRKPPNTNLPAKRKTAKHVKGGNSRARKKKCSTPPPAYSLLQTTSESVGTVARPAAMSLLCGMQERGRAGHFASRSGGANISSPRFSDFSFGVDMEQTLATADFNFAVDMEQPLATADFNFAVDMEQPLTTDSDTYASPPPPLTSPPKYHHEGKEGMLQSSEISAAPPVSAPEIVNETKPEPIADPTEPVTDWFSLPGVRENAFTGGAIRLEDTDKQNGSVTVSLFMKQLALTVENSKRLNLIHLSQNQRDTIVKITTLANHLSMTLSSPQHSLGLCSASSNASLCAENEGVGTTAPESLLPPLTTSVVKTTILHSVAPASVLAQSPMEIAKLDRSNFHADSLPQRDISDVDIKKELEAPA